MSYWFKPPWLLFSWNIFILRIIQKNMYLHSHFHHQMKFNHCFSSCFHHHFLLHHTQKTFLYCGNLKILVSLKQHNFNIKHYLCKNYLLKRLILAYIWILKLLKKLFKEVYWRTWFCRTVYTGGTSESADVTWLLTKGKLAILLLAFVFSVF